MTQGVWRTEFLDSIDSTNAEARRRAEAGEPDPLWIAAAGQTAGRGRRGRDWTSAPGNLFCTLLLRPDCGPDRIAQLGFVAGLAAAETAERWTDPAAIRLKWPNDLLVSGAKTAGILLETGDHAAGRWCAIGIGLNLVSAPSDTPYPATHLSAHLAPGAPAPTPQAALDRLSAAFAHHYDRWTRHGFAPIRTQWLKRAAGLGAPIRVQLPGETLDGVFDDLNHEGALILQDASGARCAVSAGDVLFPPPFTGQGDHAKHGGDGGPARRRSV